MQVEVRGVVFTIEEAEVGDDGVRGWGAEGTLPEGHVIERFSGWWAASATVDDIVADIGGYIDELVAKAAAKEA